MDTDSLLLIADAARAAGRVDYAARPLTATGLLPWRTYLEYLVFDRLLSRPDYQVALKELDAILARQRAQVVAMLCGFGWISPTWQPAPAGRRDAAGRMAATWHRRSCR